MKHLFHGTSETDPSLIHKTKDELDIRFLNAGRYGTGIDFTNNSGYSHIFTHKKGNICQFFVCLVLVGDSVNLEEGNYRIPPLKLGSTHERYDSINNGSGGHYIIYDIAKHYPGYLISYA